MLSLTDSWKGKLVTRGQARVSAYPPLDRREEYFHSFKKALLKAPWTVGVKKCGDNKLGLSTLRCEKGHRGSFSQIQSRISVQLQIQSRISVQLGDGEFLKGAQESHRERQQQLLGSWTPSHQNVGVRDYTEIGCQCLVAKVHRNITVIPPSPFKSLSPSFPSYGDDPMV